ncbi:hypothetical protein Ancab_033021 [Ancistrocladus abbreviatus]
MALETIPSNDLLSLMMIYDSAFLMENTCLKPQNRHHRDGHGSGAISSQAVVPSGNVGSKTTVGRRQNLGVVVQQAAGRKRRKRRAKVCKNKEEAETQRITHIVVERNRRKQMNEHLAVLRSLMPDSYAQRGDQASIVGGAIEYVKELEHHLQSLEAQKMLLLQQAGGSQSTNDTTTASGSTSSSRKAPPFSEFFAYPQYTCSQSQLPNKYSSKSKASMAEIEVTLIETHANLRILARRSPRQLSNLVAGFQTLHLTILHLNVTTVDPLVLYSISAKVEEECQLTSADDIAESVHHMLGITGEEAAALYS